MSKASYLFIAILAHFFQIKNAAAQYIFIGGGGAYNSVILQAGYDLRLCLETEKRIGLFADFFHLGPGIKETSNDALINEFYLSMNAKIDAWRFSKFKLYFFGGYIYSKWINETKFYPGIYHGANMGGGFDYQLSRCSLFLEANTNSIWWEANFILGIKINLNTNKLFRKGHNPRYNLNLQDNNNVQ